MLLYSVNDKRRTTEAPRQIEMQTEEAAVARGVALEVFQIRQPDEMAPAVERARASGCAALNVPASSLFLHLPPFWRASKPFRCSPMFGGRRARQEQGRCVSL